MLEMGFVHNLKLKESDVQSLIIKGRKVSDHSDCYLKVGFFIRSNER